MNLFQTLLSVPFGIPVRGIAGSCGDSVLSFLRSGRTVFHSVYTSFTFPPAMCEGSGFSTSLPALTFHVSDYSHPSKCEVVSPCGFLYLFVDLSNSESPWEILVTPPNLWLLSL